MHDLCHAVLIGSHIYSSLGITMFITIKFLPLPHLIHFFLNSDLTEINMTVVGFSFLTFVGLPLFFLVWSASLRDFAALVLKQ